VGQPEARLLSQAVNHSNVSCRFVPHFFFELDGENEDRAPVILDTQELQHRATGLARGDGHSPARVNLPTGWK